MAADQSDSFGRYRRPTRRDVFLATMDRIVPWAALCKVIEPHYPKTGNGRPPVGLSRMLRMYFVQHWFNLADVACEEALLDSASVRRFVGIGSRQVSTRRTHLELSIAVDNDRIHFLEHPRHGERKGACPAHFPTCAGPSVGLLSSQSRSMLKHAGGCCLVKLF